MSGEPAIRKVLVAFKALLEKVADVTVWIDRSDEEPFGNAESPALNIRLLNVGWEPHSHGTTLHTAEIDIDIFVARGSVGSISDEHAEIGARIVETVMSDQFLGGMLMNLTEQGMSGDIDNGADQGIVPLKYLASFLTPLGDHRTILGQSQTFA